MKNRKLWLLLGGIVLVLVLALTPLMAGCAAPPEEVKPPVEEKPPVEKPPVEKPPEKVFELTYSTITMEDAVSTITHWWWMDEVEKRTNGRVHFTRYHSAQLFGGFDSLAGLSKGGCDVSAVLGTFNPAELDLLCGLGLPLLGGDVATYEKACTEMIRTDPRLIEEATRNNIHYLGQEMGLYWYLNTAEKRITKLEDLAGLTIWAMGPYAPFVDAAGGTPTVIDITEIYESAERGLIDGLIFGLTDTYSVRVYEVTKYFTDIGLGPYNGTWATSINLDTWNSLPPDIQQIINDTLDECMRVCVDLCRQTDEERLQVFREAGLTLEALPPEEMERVKAMAPVVIDWWVNIKPEEAAARRQFVQDFIDILERTTVPSEWLYDSAALFK